MQFFVVSTKECLHLTSVKLNRINDRGILVLVPLALFHQLGKDVYIMWLLLGKIFPWIALILSQLWVDMPKGLRELFFI